MKTAFVISLLAACLGLGHNAFSQESNQDKGNVHATLSWEQLARHSGLVELKARAQDEFKVDALFAGPAQLSCVRAEIQLTAAGWAHFTKSDTRIALFARWSHGKLEDRWQELVGSSPFAAYRVDASSIPVENHHVGLVNEEAGESRLYVLVPGKDGKTGSLFYFYLIQKPRPLTADELAKDPFAEKPASTKP